MAILGCVLELDRKYQANDYNGTKTEGENYQVIAGRVPILFSAPHTVNQIREGGIKERDGVTGGITEYLCQHFGTFGVIRTWNNHDDPNYAQDVASERYRQQVVELVKENDIQWVFDVHGILGKYGIDINLGVNEGRNVACDMGTIEQMVGLWPQDLVVKIDDPFRAVSPWTVSNYVHRATGVNCVQMELSTKVRVTEAGLEGFLAGMENVVEMILANEVKHKYDKN